MSVADQLLNPPTRNSRRNWDDLPADAPNATTSAGGATWKLLNKEASPARRALIEQALPRTHKPPSPRLPSDIWHRKRLIPSAVLPQQTGKLDGYSAQNIPQELGSAGYTE
ncbi:hypothetical protein ACIRRH_43805 [Kitasatospora sp. NPDC101235]|uniref:hypothetical protein n=1 Tax=Kitasatospora sp. NPDC101235 TaxID=3364101 RepID=UPI00382500AC